MQTWRFTCLLERLSKEERARKVELMDELSRAVEEVEELERGYRFQYQAGAVPWASLAEFVDLERRCCPFFTFTAQVGPEGSPVSLAVIGAEGIKEFLRAQGPGTERPDR